MKHIVTIASITALLTLGSLFAAPVSAQTTPPTPSVEIPTRTLSEIKTQHTRLASLLPRLETTITLLTRRGFDTKNAVAALTEAHAHATQSTLVLESKEVVLADAQKTLTETRTLLTAVLKEIRISMETKRN